MYKIELIENEIEKSETCKKILSALPSWFGNQSAIDSYSEEVKHLPLYVCRINNETIGFVALKIHNEYTAEVCVMGVLENYHRHGIGRMLIECCEKYCIENYFKFLTVKTLAETAKDEGYARTRKFYFSMGFRPLEIFPELWDINNPCLLMAKYLSM